MLLDIEIWTIKRAATLADLRTERRGGWEETHRIRNTSESEERYRRTGLHGEYKHKVLVILPTERAFSGPNAPLSSFALRPKFQFRVSSYGTFGYWQNFTNSGDWYSQLIIIGIGCCHLPYASTTTSEHNRPGPIWVMEAAEGCSSSVQFEYCGVIHWLLRIRWIDFPDFFLIRQSGFQAPYKHRATNGVFRKRSLHVS